MGLFIFLRPYTMGPLGLLETVHPLFDRAFSKAHPEELANRVASKVVEELLSSGYSNNPTTSGQVEDPPTPDPQDHQEEFLKCMIIQSALRNLEYSHRPVSTLCQDYNEQLKSLLEAEVPSSMEDRLDAVSTRITKLCDLLTKLRFAVQEDLDLVELLPICLTQLSSARLDQACLRAFNDPSYAPVPNSRDPEFQEIEELLKEALMFLPDGLLPYMVWCQYQVLKSRSLPLEQAIDLLQELVQGHPESHHCHSRFKRELGLVHAEIAIRRNDPKAWAAAQRLLLECPAELYYRYYEVTKQEPYRLMARRALRDLSEELLKNPRGSVRKILCMEGLALVLGQGDLRYQGTSETKRFNIKRFWKQFPKGTVSKVRIPDPKVPFMVVGVPNKLTEELRAQILSHIPAVALVEFREYEPGITDLTLDHCCSEGAHVVATDVTEGQYRLNTDFEAPPFCRVETPTRQSVVSRPGRKSA